MNRDGSNVQRITNHPSIDATPTWSPTGTQIASTSDRTGSPQIYVMDAEGTNVRRISHDGSWNDDAVFSPNGEQLAYTSRVNNRFQMGGTAAASAEYRQAHLPLLIHSQPHRAVFLGLGTGITLGGALLYSELVNDGVELVPEEGRSWR